MNTMAGQGPSSLVVRDVVLDTLSAFGDIHRHFQGLAGYLHVDLPPISLTSDGRRSNLVISFATAVDASNALLSRPQVSIAGQVYDVMPHSDDFGELEGLISDSPPPRKRQKKEVASEILVCKICFEELDGAYSEPCRKCKGAHCYGCVKKIFEMALRDSDRMPATCCDSVMHHEVIRGLLPNARIEEYRLKYDERNTINPLYCPVPTCSTFIPPRMFNHSTTKVTCHGCNTVICTKCKKQAVDRHTCAEEVVRQSILETFHYKTCPKCGTGVMKMLGCSHMRCQCGAHWCWDCRRPWNACTQQPCGETSDDEQPPQIVEGDDEISESDDDDDAETAAEDFPTSTVAEPTRAIGVSEPSINVTTSDNGPNQNTFEQATQTHAPTSSETSSTSETATSEPQNLDDPDEIDWRCRGLNFGAEPREETWDTWGCRHRFRNLGKHLIPRFWLVGVNASKDPDVGIECMSCFKRIKLWENKGTENLKHGGGILVDGVNVMKGGEACAAPAAPVVTKVTKNNTRSQLSSECHKCGVIYCEPCKRAAMRRIRSEQAAPGLN